MKLEAEINDKTFQRIVRMADLLEIPVNEYLNTIFTQRLRHDEALLGFEIIDLDKYNPNKDEWTNG